MTGRKPTAYVPLATQAQLQAFVHLVMEREVKAFAQADEDGEDV